MFAFAPSGPAFKTHVMYQVIIIAIQRVIKINLIILDRL